LILIRVHLSTTSLAPIPMRPSRIMNEGYASNKPQMVIDSPS
jgi:hypothetical protein